MKKILFVVLLFLFLQRNNCFATENELDFSEYDFSEIEDVISEENNFSFSEIVQQIVSGDIKGVEDGFINLFNMALKEFVKEKDVIIKIMIIGIIAALFSNISGAVFSGKISETGFYIATLLMMIVLLAGYRVINELVINTMQRIIRIMEAATPVYMLSVGFSSGSGAQTAFYQVVIIVIALIEKVLIGFVLPLIYMYLITNILNNMTDGKIFTKAQELIKTIIDYCLKTLMTFVIGINIVRGLINPILDSIKVGTTYKILGSIPGVGNALNSVTGIVMASASLIKNGIGIAAMLTIIFVCFTPVVKTIIVSLLYKGVAAVLEPISDKRIINSINGVYISISLMLKTMLYGIVFFILSIAIICASTSYGV